MTRGEHVGRRHIKPGQLKRVCGLIMKSMAFGMIFAWVFPGVSFFFMIIFMIAGFYFLFM